MQYFRNNQKNSRSSPYNQTLKGPKLKFDDVWSILTKVYAFATATGEKIPEKFIISLNLTF